MSGADEPIALDRDTERLLRDLAPQVLGALVRRTGDFAAAEDAVQEALLAAALQWPRDVVPDNPAGWLYRVANRRMTDLSRSEQARRAREEAVATAALVDTPAAPPADEAAALEQDDAVILLFMCCHPALTRASRVALTLRAVGGLTTAQIASAFLVPEATMAQRISRAKQTIRRSGGKFEMPGREELADRLAAVLHVLYLIFNEGYASSTGPHLQRIELATEGIRLARALHALRPDEPEVTGLLALMLLTDARRGARTGPHGELIPLDEQDRSLWNREAIAEGTALVTQAFSRGAVGPYQLQAAIAALHDEAPGTDQTDWPQILALYGVLLRMSDNPIVALNHAIAAAMVHGPATGLELLAALDNDARIAGHYRLEAVRAHLLDRSGDAAAAIRHYRAAAAGTANTAERNYLMEKALRLGGGRKD